jgi:transcriptional regulator with XRE-family HTH domain
MEVFAVEVFGERLRTRRRERGLTQNALAQQMGVAQGWLSELENARQGAVQADTVYRLCVALNCSADYLLGLADTPSRETPPRPRRKRPAKAADGEQEEAA